MEFLDFPSLSQLSEFHFLRPGWFSALIPLAILWFWLRRSSIKQSGWQSVIPSHLYQHMIIGKAEKGKRPPLWALSLVWLLSVIALAGPTFERLPQPVYQLKMGHVIVLDMSLSMRATDMTPDRLTRAKYKAIDLVNAIGEGEMGLVAYAGDAFVISPLTEDAANITALLPSLSPEIMPVPGSDPLLGIESAASLLINAGYNSGMIYWITDGIDFAQQKELQEYVSSIPFTVNALTIGTSQGAPIRQVSGELLKDSSGSIVIPKLNNSAVRGVVRASGGTFETFTSNDKDIDALASLSLEEQNAASDENEETGNQGDQWKEIGPFLLLIIVPFASIAFRRGLLFVFLVGVLAPLTTPTSHAQEQVKTDQVIDQATDTPPSLPWWKKPFLNNDQEGYSHYENARFDKAATEFSDASWKASSMYKSGDYESALSTFEAGDDATSLYNQGNALAKLGRFEEAIEKYDSALTLSPDMEDAIANKALLESLLEQQQQQQQQQDQQNQQSGDQNQQNSGDDSGDSDNQNGQNQNQDNDSQGQPENQNEGEQNESNGEQQNDSSEQNSPQDSSSDNEQNSEEQNAEEAQSENDGDADTKDDGQTPTSENGEQNQDMQQQAMQGQAGELTDAEKEAQQRMESLMRRVPDDPAFLLKRKMQLEAQKRQRQRMPSNRSDW